MILWMTGEELVDFHNNRFVCAIWVFDLTANSCRIFRNDFYLDVCTAPHETKLTTVFPETSFKAKPKLWLQYNGFLSLKECIPPAAQDWVLSTPGAGAKENFDKLEVVYGSGSLSQAAVYKIFAKVKAGEDTEDRRGKTSTRTGRTCDNIEAVRAVVTSDRHLAPADFFLFPKCKKELAGVTLKWEDVTTNLDGVCGTIPIVDFVDAFHAWKRRFGIDLDGTKIFGRVDPPHPDLTRHLRLSGRVPAGVEQTDPELDEVAAPLNPKELVPEVEPRHPLHHHHVPVQGHVPLLDNVLGIIAQEVKLLHVTQADAPRLSHELGQGAIEEKSRFGVGIQAVLEDNFLGEEEVLVALDIHALLEDVAPPLEGDQEIQLGGRILPASTGMAGGLRGGHSEDELAAPDRMDLGQRPLLGLDSSHARIAYIPCQEVSDDEKGLDFLPSLDPPVC
eukprot:snap_masked-scaffold325_size206031-processed-gene-1.11 protein:Tk11605 transcript:snap_masked-scaffold325_size206031-processed-gene-1.11-mRNA-1 annotation:"Putative uncharacterized protein FLJ37770"